MKNNQYSLFLTGVFFFLFFCSLHAQNLWTLEQYIDIALANNRNVRQQDLTRQSKKITYEQARQNLLPNLNAFAGQNFSFGRSLNNNNIYESANSSQTIFSVSSSLTLFDGLRLKNSIDQQRIEMHASEADLEKIKADITLSVTTAFLQVLMNKELLQLAEEQLLLTQAKIERQKSLVESGKLVEGELFELQAQEAKEELNQVQAENFLKLSLLDLVQILELDDSRNLDVVMSTDLNPNDLFLPSVKTVYENAVRNRPEIKSAELRLKSSEKPFPLLVPAIRLPCRLVEVSTWLIAILPVSITNLLVIKWLRI
ncbi:MAG: TolC family protein [Prevotellaceae bacterium]|jgi:outer membrane protein|nr:TolC family protein [Prevotellaceae bacterium]